MDSILFSHSLEQFFFNIDFIVSLLFNLDSIEDLNLVYPLMIYYLEYAYLSCYLLSYFFFMLSLFGELSSFGLAFGLKGLESTVRR